ncbi:MAG: signal peptidase I [Acidimicrobiales bacterium]
MHHRILTLTGQFLGLVLGAFAVFAVVTLGLGPTFGGYRVMTVLTASMRPSMPEGSLMVQTPVPLDQVVVGDVITYRIPVDDRRVVTHRVVEVVAGGDHPVVRTKGDANNAPDTWLAQLTGDRVWKMRFAVPKAGYGVQALRRPLAQRLTLLAVPFVLALVWLRDIWVPRDRPRPASPGAAPNPPIASAPPVLGRWRVVLALSALGALAALDRPARTERPRRGLRGKLA